MSINIILLTAVAVFIGVAALIIGLYLSFRGDHESKVESRLALLAEQVQSGGKKGKKQKKGLLLETMDEGPQIFEQLLSRFGGLRSLLRQADVNLPPIYLIGMMIGFGIAGTLAAVLSRLPLALMPLAMVAGLFLPIGWLLWRRKRRQRTFATQLPEAMDMLARALRAGQSLNAAIGLVSREIPPPLGTEFARVFDEQNLGVPLDESLNDLTERVPNLDLKFFATAVILQRQTGGDLAEILEKIGNLIRQRFQIWGQVQALTGEGRLSGVVLLALPVFLFFAMYYLNRDYVMLLFTDPMGRKMLAGAVVMQIVGALFIRKIVNIKV